MNGFENWGMFLNIPHFYIHPCNAFRPLAGEQNNLLDYKIRVYVNLLL